MMQAFHASPPDTLVQRQLLHELVLHSRTAQWTAIGVGSVTAILLLMTTAQPLVAAWWLALIGISVLRLAAFSHASIPEEASAQRQYRRRFAIALAASGALWGALPFSAGHPTAYQFALYFIIIGGIGAGATTSLASQRDLLPVFLVPALGGVMISLFVHEAPYAGFLAATVLFYLLGMMTLHRTQHRMLRTMVETRLQLTETLDSLRDNQSDRETLARRLQTHHEWISRFLGITTDPELDFEFKTQRLLNLLRENLAADGIAVCRSRNGQLHAVHRMDSNGQMLAPRGLFPASLLDAVQPGDETVAIHHFGDPQNPLTELFDIKVRTVVAVRLHLNGKLFGCLLAAYRRNAPSHLRAIQHELLNLSSSWLTMELIRHGAMTRLQENRESLARIANSVPCMIAFVDADRRYRYANTRYLETFDVTPGALIGKRLDELASPSTMKLIAPYVSQALAGKAQEFEFEPHHDTDAALENHILKVCYTPSRSIDGSVDGFYVLAIDITEDATERRRLHDKSSRDVLTGLRNRAYFLEQVRHEASHWNSERNCYLLLLDIDGFHSVNEFFGYTFGDRVLRQLADEMSSILPGEDSLVRIGSDEFLFVIREDNLHLAEDLARRLIDSVNNMAIEHRDEHVHLGLSIGIARSDNRSGFKGVYRRAREALAASKQRGRNRHTLHFE